MTALRVLIASLLATAPLAAADAPLLAGRLVLNEVLYDPAGADAGAEAVEIFNPTPFAVALDGWSLTDGDACRPAAGANLTTYAHALAGEVPPFGHVVVTLPNVGSVPKCLSLANGGDDLALLDASGAVVDALAWGAGGKEGRSLQRCAADERAVHAAPTLGAPNEVCPPSV